MHPERPRSARRRHGAHSRARVRTEPAGRDGILEQLCSAGSVVCATDRRTGRMSWLEALPAFLVTIAVLVVPGAAITVAFGVRGVTAVVLTPLASVSVIGLTTLLGTVLPLPWSAL